MNHAHGSAAALTLGLLLAAAAAPSCSSGAQPVGTGGAGGQATTAASTTGHTGTTTAATTTTATTGTTTSATTSSGTGGGSACPPTSDTVLAITKLYFGDTAPNDQPDPNGWKQYGFNVDNLVSSGHTASLCDPVNNAAPDSIQVDGNGGIDNSFGKNVLPSILGIQMDFPKQVNMNIAAGLFTVTFKFGGLTPASDQGPLITKVYAGTSLGGAAKFDGTDCWPVAPEGLSDPLNPETAKTVFTMSSMKGNHWVSGTTGTVTVSLPFATSSINLQIHQAQLAMDLDADHKGATGGMIGGVLDTQELVTEIKKVGFAVNQCGIAAALITQIEKASDIMADGSQQAGVPCTGISVGLGFNAKQVAFGTVGPNAPVAGHCP